MPASQLAPARPCGSTRNYCPVLTSRRLPSCSIRMTGRVCCEFKARQPSEDERTEDDSDSSDMEGGRGGRKVVRDLAQDNSFIGVLVLALGTGLVTSANTLLSAFGIEPATPRRKSRVKGVSLPPQRRNSTVVRLTDRPAPKLEVLSETSGWGPAVVSRPGERSGKDSSVATPSSGGGQMAGTTVTSPITRESSRSMQPPGSEMAARQTADQASTAKPGSQGIKGDALGSFASAAGASDASGAGGTSVTSTATGTDAVEVSPSTGSSTAAASSSRVGVMGESIASGMDSAAFSVAGAPEDDEKEMDESVTSRKDASGPDAVADTKLSSRQTGSTASLAAASDASKGARGSSTSAASGGAVAGQGRQAALVGSASAPTGSGGGSFTAAPVAEPPGGPSGAAPGTGTADSTGRSPSDKLPVADGAASKAATTWPAVATDAVGAVAGIGSTKYSQTTTSRNLNYATASSGGGAGLGGGKGRGGGGGGGGEDDVEDDGMRARFPWVPVLLFVAAAASYPVFRHRMDDDEGRGTGGSASRGKDALDSLKALVAAGVAAGSSAASSADSSARQMVEGAKVGWADMMHRAGELRASLFERESGKQAAAVGTGAGAAASQLPATTVVTASQVTATAGSKGKSSSAKGTAWWWYPLVLAAAGVAAYFVITHASGDDGASAAGAAAAGLAGASGSTRYGNTRAASSSHFVDSSSTEVSNEVGELYTRFQQRDIEYAKLSESLERIEQQESKLRQDSATDVQAVRQQIQEMRQSLSKSRSEA